MNINTIKNKLNTLKSIVPIEIVKEDPLTISYGKEKYVIQIVDGKALVSGFRISPERQRKLELYLNGRKILTAEDWNANPIVQAVKKKGTGGNKDIVNKNTKTGTGDYMKTLKEEMSQESFEEHLEHFIRAHYGEKKVDNRVIKAAIRAAMIGKSVREKIQKAEAYVVSQLGKLHESIDFKDRVRQFLEEFKPNKRKEAGYKSMAKSAGTTKKDAKEELKKLDKEGVVADIKKRAKNAKDPEAYKWGTIRSIISQHAKKNK